MKLWIETSTCKDGQVYPVVPGDGGWFWESREGKEQDAQQGRRRGSWKPEPRSVDAFTDPSAMVGVSLKVGRNGTGGYCRGQMLGLMTRGPWLLGLLQTNLFYHFLGVAAAFFITQRVTRFEKKIFLQTGCKIRCVCWYQIPCQEQGTGGWFKGRWNFSGDRNG